MSILSFGAVFFLAFVLGRNNLSNIFGFAIGTKMITFRKGVVVAALFFAAGAIISGAATTQNVSRLGEVTGFAESFALCASAGAMLIILGRMGCPASIVQTMTGAYIAFDLFTHRPLPQELLMHSVFAWFYAPVLGAFFTFFGFKGLQNLLRRYPIRLLLRDKANRLGLLSVGAFSAYAFGANNMGSIVGPLVSLVSLEFLLPLVSAFVALGFFFADRKVIKTVSKGLFPLSSTEAFVVVLMSAFTLILFSSQTLAGIAAAWRLPWFQLVPIPLSSVLVGSVFGIALSKGITGLKFKTLGLVLISQFISPAGAGLFCYGLLICLKG